MSFVVFANRNDPAAPASTWIVRLNGLPGAGGRKHDVARVRSLCAPWACGTLHWRRRPGPASPPGGDSLDEGRKRAGQGPGWHRDSPTKAAEQMSCRPTP